ncbi:aromatic amino acid lyase [candidate division KSB1 bacterium]|nr:aromatic amino acid lyase [candidate division KSB1 bacterium]NIR72556.1 aromatic amino acid lyase [candidate division KSB1 bacterium]NIS27308.1 aromatic amino acid lyase [candidate division KSB1 bacterium]NIT73518.1 aromatic amino acid lyase [candidate division KSB1 bacterium]NIU28038.1 aromatic amino acid lyase [candidate division KSB1 bacterium]
MSQTHYTPEEIKVVSINEEELTIPKIVAVARYLGSVEPFKGPKRTKVEEIRKYVEENWLSDTSEPQYGFNTGVGALKNVKISQENIKKFQELYIKSHSVGVGEPFDVEIVRATMLLQANALAKGYSGIRPIIIDKLIEMLNKGIHPVVPEQGSLGASGDLAPLTHITAVLVGENDADVWVDQQKARIRDLKISSDVLKFQRDGEDVTFQTIDLHGKEAVSLTNSTAVMLAISCLLIHDVERLLGNADISAALSLEAMMCEKDAFAEELHALRNQEGQIRTATNIRQLTAGSKRMTAEARRAYFVYITKQRLNKNLKESKHKDWYHAVKHYKLNYEFEQKRVQDAYSLRCVPQVHGACKDAFRHVKSIVEREISAVTDNPVIFATRNGAGYEAKSGGNFHGEPLALALDFLALALAEIGSISERRMFRLLSPTMSFGLPRNLTGGEPGLNSGYMLIQYTSAQLVSENKILAHPACVDSIPTSDNQEDHVSMGMTSARKANRILDNVQNLIAMEFMCAVQGIHLSSQDERLSLAKFPLGKGTSAVFNFIKEYQVTDEGVKPFQRMQEDEFVHTKIQTMRRLSDSDQILSVFRNKADFTLLI